VPDFDDVRFPTVIARGAVGGPERRTEIVALVSGHEERNTPWADSRRRYDVGYGIAPPTISRAWSPSSRRAPAG
jgi:uncharacterized protein (TIGR02217 family)